MLKDNNNYCTNTERTTYQNHLPYWTDNERIRFQLKNEEKDAQELYCYQRLLASVSHFEDVSDLDRRTYFLTISFKSNYLKPTHWDIYRTYLKAHTGSFYGRGSDRPGIIFDDDVAGSKYGEGRNENHHFHGLITVPIALNRKIMGEDGEHKLLICPVEKMPNVLSVHCRPFDLKKPLSYVIGYGSKFVCRKKKMKRLASPFYLRNTLGPWIVLLRDCEKGQKRGCFAGTIKCWTSFIQIQARCSRLNT